MNINGTILSVTKMKGSVLVKGTLNTFCLKLYIVRHMVKDHSKWKLAAITL